MHRKVHSLSRCDSARDVDDNHNDNDVVGHRRREQRKVERQNKRDRERMKERERDVVTLPGNLHIYRICLLCIQPAAEVLALIFEL